MKNRLHFFLPGIIVASIVLLFTACKKINEATELGGDLIPVVDNITTFDTTINIDAYNELFDALSDSQRLGRSEEQFLGRINNDPLFGGTDARMFLELKPINYPYTFMNSKKDSLYLDSVVIILNYVETYGDSMVPQTVNVYEISQTSEFKDSVYLIRENSFTYAGLLGTATILPANLDDSVKAFRDTTLKQMRIRLDDNFGRRLLDYDSVPGPNGAYASDSAFRSKFRGFAFQSMNSGNAVMGFNLGGVNTKLAIYYRYKKNIQEDTTVDYFRFTTLSAAANYVQRDHSTGEINAAQGGSTPDQLVYIQNTPGTFATLKIPDLANISNRLVHRAELIVEQVYHASDTLFPAPEFLYLDAHDSTIVSPRKKFRTIPYDLSYDGQDYNRVSFGSFPLRKVDGNGKSVKIWKFNISRYVQHVLTNTVPLYDLRLSAPFAVVSQYGTPPISGDATIGFFVNQTIVKGRVRLGGGNHPTQRMRLRLIYSKI